MMRAPTNGGLMKQIRVIAFVLASMTAAVPFAGAQVAAQGGRSAGAVRAERGRMHGGLMRGLKLSATEKAKVKSVHEKYAAETKPMRESLRSAMQEARADRQKGDTAAARAVIQRTKSNRESLRSVMERERAEMRAALTPANQKQFDANVTQAAAKGGRKAKGMKGRRAGIANG